MLYTECDSTPDFCGYVNSKKKAKQWCLEEMDFRGIDIKKLQYFEGEFYAEMEDDCHYIHAVKVERKK